MKKTQQPGDLFNAHKAMAMGKKMPGMAMKKPMQKPLKKTGTFKGKSNKLGGGGRFAQLAAKAGGGKKGAAIAAAVGRKKYGAKKMAAMAAKGRKKA